MRKTLGTVSVLALLVAGIQSTSAEPKGEHATIKGEMVDLWCYLEGGDRGAAKKGCATAKAGNPVGLVDAKGNLYVTAGLKDHEAGRALLCSAKTIDVCRTRVMRPSTQDDIRAAGR